MGDLALLAGAAAFLGAAALLASDSPNKIDQRLKSCAFLASQLRISPSTHRPGFEHSAGVPRETPNPPIRYFLMFHTFVPYKLPPLREVSYE